MIPHLPVEINEQREINHSLYASGTDIQRLIVIHRKNSNLNMV